MEKFGVIGNPIKQSKSPFIHQKFAEQTGVELTYEPLLGDIGGFENNVIQFIEKGGRGLNVTAPFKEEACRFADGLSERAQFAQSVNTLAFLYDGRVLGDNTDGVGLVSDLKSSFGEISGCKLIIIGAGGATRGVIKPLFDAGVSHVHIANRTVEKAEMLAKHFAQAGSVSFSDLKSVGDIDATIVVNATSTGINEQTLNIDPKVFEQVNSCYDMFYSKTLTPFNKHAISINSDCRVSDGLGMLVGQAAESFYIWTGERPNVSPILEELRSFI